MASDCLPHQLTLFDRTRSAGASHSPKADESMHLFVQELVLECAEVAADDAIYAEEMRVADESATRRTSRYTARGSARGTYRMLRNGWVKLDESELDASGELGDFASLGEVGFAEEFRHARERGNSSTPSGFSSGQEAELVAELRGVRASAVLERAKRKAIAGSVKEWFWFDP
jgi:hypothetical protein